MAILTPKLLRVGIADAIREVDGIGRIHQQRRIITTEPQVRALLADEDGLINAWMISPSPNQRTESERTPGHGSIGTQGGGQTITTFRYQIEGFYTIQDALNSEQTFDDLSWAVADHLNSFGLINIVDAASNPAVLLQEPADVDQFGYINLAGAILLHYCRIETGWQGRTRPLGS